MADLSHAESAMAGKHFGKANLIDDDSFWADCLAVYPDKVVPLPVVDSPESRRRLSEMLECPAPDCGQACCKYERVLLSKLDLKRLDGLNTIITPHENTLVLACTGGCQFLNPSAEGGACTIYSKRPDVCHQFPIQAPRDAVIDGKTPFKQVQYRLKCEPGVRVIRAVMREALSGDTMILLPDLSLVPIYRDKEKAHVDDRRRSSDGGNDR